LQVGLHDPLDSQQPRIAKNPTDAGLATFAGQTKRLQRDIETQLVSELEAVSDGAVGTVYPDMSCSEFESFETSLERLRIEAINLGGKRFKFQPVVTTPRHGQVYSSGDLGSDVVNRESGDKAYHGFGGADCYDGEIGILVLLGVCEAVEPAGELGQFAGIPELIERCRVNAESQRLLGAQGSSVTPESLDCGSYVSGLSHNG